MIVSVSRRTDIPAIYSDWFFNRIADGYVLVRNPFNFHQVSKVALDIDSVDCFVFWTKCPEKFMKRLGQLASYSYYFQFTLNPYGEEIERGLPPKTKIIEMFRELSDIISPSRLIWRYDPVLLNDNQFTPGYHTKQFESLCRQLNRYTKKCVISFFDHYKFAAERGRALGIVTASVDTMRLIGSSFAKIGSSYGLTIETCAESVDLSEFGIKHGKCVDNRMISEILGYDIDIEKDRTQREFCGCIKSVDIGSYSTCINNCLYCYATRSNESASKCFNNHDPKSPLIFGELLTDDKVTVRKNERFRFRPGRLAFE